MKKTKMLIIAAFFVALFVVFLNGREVYYKLVNDTANVMDKIDIVILSLIGLWHL